MNQPSTKIYTQHHLAIEPSVFIALLSKCIMTKPLVLMDVDGVIANWVQATIDTHGFGIEHHEYTNWDFHRTMGLTDEDMWKPTNNGYWWRTIKPYDHADELIDAVRDRADVVYCTSPSIDATCPTQKVQWLRDHGFMHSRKNDYQIGPRKELNAGSGAILIDDSDSNVAKYRDAGGTAILFPQPWNENREHAVLRNRVEFVCTELDVMLSASA